MEKKHLYRRLNKYKHSGEGQVDSVELGKIYHVIEGRNAWHSTWVLQYAQNSFYSSLAAAKYYAEDMRKSGSVFTILELPSLVIRSNSKVVFITEVNVDRPLFSHCLDEVGSNINVEVKSDYTSRLDFLPDMVKAFMYTSIGWNRKVNERDIILLEHENKGLKTSKVGMEIHSRSSRSIGVECFLLWSDKKRPVDFSSLESIVASLCLIKEEKNFDSQVVEEKRFSEDDEIRVIESLIVKNHSKGNGVDEKKIIGLVELFLSELRVAYTFEAISRAEIEKLTEIFDDWLRSLEYYAPRDREEILLSRSIGEAQFPFTQYRAQHGR